MLTSIIIGGGIGGLTCAIAMAKRGFDVVVFEQASEFRPLGAGIVLWINAMRVLKELGLAEELLLRGNRLKTFAIKRYDGKQLTQTNIQTLEEEFSIPSIGIDRAELHEVLMNRIPTHRRHFGERLIHCIQTKNKATAIFESGTKISADLIIGADGIHSEVRKKILGDSPLRDAQQICFRGICDATSIVLERSHMFEAWGKSKRFGIVPIGHDKIYWYLTLNRNNTLEPPQEPKEFLLEKFQDWVAPIPAILSHTSPHFFLRNDLYDRPPVNRWHQGRIVLLGDAAHPMTPDLGQGAAMAIESAAVLASCLEKYKEFSSALQNYEQSRMPRTRSITNQSWRMGKIATLNNSLAMSVRNFFMRFLSRFVYQQTKRLFESP
jgi:2-polyprenyl-6-methoxyphenol hydroxylase-like FAD-dependent oxidoreductase